MPDDSGELADPFAQRKTDENALSLRPVEVEVESFDDLDREAGIFDVLTPELSARRARMRRIVAGIVSVAAVASVLAAVRLARKHSQPAADASILAAQATVASVEIVAEPPSQPLAAPVVAAPVEPTSAPAAAPAEAKTNAPASRPNVRELKKQAQAAIDNGRYDEAIALSRTVVDLDPTDAAAYLFLGGVLQEAGQWERAARVFSKCASKAKRGAVAECKSLAEQ